MNASMPLCIAKALAPFAPPSSAVHKIIRVGNHSLCLKIGEGRALAHCTFDVSSDGEVESLMVHAGDTDITNYLSFEQLEQIEIACMANYLKEAKEHNADLRINNYLAGL